MLNAGVSLSRRGHGDSLIFIRVNFVANASDRNSEHSGRASTASAIMGQRVNDEFAFDLLDRVTDKVRSDFIQSKFSSTYRLLPRQTLISSCD